MLDVHKSSIIAQLYFFYQSFKDLYLLDFSFLSNFCP
jgi:hypothetical protein